LEAETESALEDLLGRTIKSDEDPAEMKALPFRRASVETLRKYFVFLRFRNSAGYREIVQSLHRAYQSHHQDGHVYPAYRSLIVQLRLRYMLRSFIKFLEHTSLDGPFSRTAPDFPGSEIALDSFQDTMERYCWRMCEAELCLGVATQDQEFILSDRCFGTLDEGFDEDP